MWDAMHAYGKGIDHNRTLTEAFTLHGYTEIHFLGLFSLLVWEEASGYY